MDNKEQKNALGEQPLETADEPEIFGRSKSREEIKADRKAARAAELAALREARKKKAAARKVDVKGKRTDLIVMGTILLAVLVACGVVLGIKISQGNEALQYEMSEEITGYFYDGAATPELSNEGVTAAINEVYYTKGGHLCVNMTLGNGTNEERRLDSLEVTINNGETGDLIASGYTEEIDETFIITYGGYEGYTFYIKPEHVVIPNDTLSTISNEITAEATAVGESVSTTATAAGSTAASTAASTTASAAETTTTTATTTAAEE